MRGFIARLTPYLDPGAGMFLWQILLSISAGLLFRCLRGFSGKPAMDRVTSEKSPSTRQVTRVKP